MGPAKYENVGKSQPVLVMVNPIVSPRPLRCTTHVEIEQGGKVGHHLIFLKACAKRLSH
jgi:hypothetical protein